MINKEELFQSISLDARKYQNENSSARTKAYFRINTGMPYSTVSRAAKVKAKSLTGEPHFHF